MGMTLWRSCTRFFPQITVARHFSNEKPWQEISIPVPWGKLRGKWWGPTDKRPILTIHGWQDNCGSYNRLIPLLNKDVGFLAIDLPGHGLSSRLPPGIYYHFTTYLLVTKLLMKYFEWPKISLIGHSMGGMSTYTFSMCYPQLVDFVACIDCGKPMIQKKPIPFTSRVLDRFLRCNQFATSSVEPPSYTWEEMKQKIHAPNNKSVSLECAHHILERNTAPSKIHPGKYYFTRDPRLQVGDMVSFLLSGLVEDARYITCPIFLARAKDEMKEDFYDVLEVLKQSSVDCDFHLIAGTHHLHLNNPQDELADLLKSFIQRHNTEDRSIGGLKEECIVSEERDP